MLTHAGEQPPLYVLLTCGMCVFIPVYPFLHLRCRPLEPYRTHTWAVPDLGRPQHIPELMYSSLFLDLTSLTWSYSKWKGGLPGNLLSQACFIGREIRLMYLQCPF